MKPFDAAIIGAGAAGLFCAATAARRGKNILLLDHAAAPGAKILISGGGRCNFTNRDVAPEHFLSDNPHFCKSALRRYTQHDFIALVAGHGIAYHEKKRGQLFCDNSARDILAMLLAICGADLRLAHKITGISKPDIFRIETDHGPFTAEKLILATGGLSIPKMGATGLAYDIARQFGLSLTEIRPALVPLTFAGAPAAWMPTLAGVSFDSLASAGGAAFRENTLFTHRGLSGPAILQISSYWRETAAITLDMLPGQDAYALLLARKTARPKAELKTVLADILPSRLAHSLPGIPAGRAIIGELSNKTLKNIADIIQKFSLTPVGTEGFAKAEVTRGGVDTVALSSQTMESRAVPGLYIIGEAVDVTGWLGGYNFQWAWSSGHAAGSAV